MRFLFYLTVFFQLLSFSFSALFPHIIWLYWNNGFQTLGTFQQICFQRIKDLHKNHDWQINFVTEKTIQNYLNQNNYQNFQKGLNKNFKFPQAKADLLRYYLLKQHGGVWMDITIILKQNLNWLDNLQSNSKVIHKNIYKNPQIFLYIQHETYRKIKNQRGKQNQMIKIKINGYDYYPLFLMQNAFIASVKESRFINDLIYQYEKLLKFGSSVYNNQKYSLQIPYTYSNYFLSFRASSINQYKKYAQYIQKNKENEKNQNVDSQFYNILIMNKMAGMYHGSRFDKRIQEYMIRSQGPFGDYQSPLMKFSQESKAFMNSILKNSKKFQQKKYKQFAQEIYQFGQKYVHQDFSCLYELFIHQNSPINKYFLQSDKQLTKKLYPFAQIIQNKNLPFICKITKLNFLLKMHPIFIYWLKIYVFFFFLFHLLLFYIRSFFSLSKKFLILLMKQKKTIHLTIIYVMALYQQKNVISQQYFLWTLFSPTASFVGTVQILITVIICKWLIGIHSQKSKSNNFILRLLIIQFLQFYFQYSNSVWKYEGQIYNYQDLNYFNMQILKEDAIHLTTIVFLSLIIIVFQFLTHIFFVHPKKCQLQQNDQISQRNDNEFSTSIFQNFDHQSQT